MFVPDFDFGRVVSVGSSSGTLRILESLSAARPPPHTNACLSRDPRAIVKVKSDGRFYRDLLQLGSRSYPTTNSHPSLESRLARSVCDFGKPRQRRPRCSSKLYWESSSLAVTTTTLTWCSRLPPTGRWRDWSGGCCRRHTLNTPT